MSKDGRLIQILLTDYRYMLQSRYIDEIEERMTSSGDAFFHVSGAGHEATGVLNNYLIADDWLHCHYRDKALMMARGISAEMFFLATLNKDASNSRGRQMNAHMSAHNLNILSMGGPVGNSALPSVGVAEIIKNKKNNPIVLCAMGDGTTQQGEVLEAIGHAMRQTLPVLFLIEDNALAISTNTKEQTFFSTPVGDQDVFQGVSIIHADGTSAVNAHALFSKVVRDMRNDRKPVIVRFKVNRLSHHTNADDQNMYREEDEIQEARTTCDPITILREHLKKNGISEEILQETELKTRSETEIAAERALNAAEPKATFSAKAPLPPELTNQDNEYFGSADDPNQLTMLEALRKTLRQHLLENEKVILFGQDIEDPKGDVFGLTKGLSTEFPDRVRNSPLAEASIVGVSVGNALAGARPVAFLQFADFLPIAYNQIFAEMGSMYWRTDGDWQVPMIIMATCGAYRPGLGPFHASSMEGIVAHTPGIDVFMPSSAHDAVGLLNVAFKSNRPTIFFYPKSLLNDRNKTTSSDVMKQVVPIGQARKTRTGNSLTLVGWGNTVILCEKVADVLAEHGIHCDVIDIRSIVPWDIELITDSVRTTQKVIIVHEDTRTAGMGAEIAATLAEKIPTNIKIRRITRPDTYVPCNFSNQIEVLPSFKTILESAVALFEGSVSWKRNAESQVGSEIIKAIGSSPSDEEITVIKWLIREGDDVRKGQIIAELEADKASVELSASQNGKIDSIRIAEGQSVKIGESLGIIKTDKDIAIRPKQITQEDSGVPIIQGINAVSSSHTTVSDAKIARAIHGEVEVGIFDITYRTGSRVVSNEEIVKNIPQWEPDDIIRRTGIESRNWLSDGESALTLAVDATKEMVERSGITLSEIGLIICSTETPIHHTPSMATLVQSHMEKDSEDMFLCPAYDVNAACTGYIYALQIAYDFLQSQPENAVLLITAESLSTKLDLSDASTAPIFADASTATLLTSNQHRLKCKNRLFRPIIGANGEDGSILNVPISEQEYIKMDGQKVFRRAAQDMITSLKRACNDALIELSDLTKVVAHQANQRILNAVSNRLQLEDGVMFSNIRNLGNTSSSTIPLCLNTLMHDFKKNQYIGLTAFGGGFTFGGSILKIK